MAVTSDRTTIPLGSESGKLQSIVVIPAQETADKPGILAMEAVSDTPERTRYFYWTDSNGVLRVDTSIPTDQDSDGTAVVASGAADTALSNLASVSVNTTIKSDTANTDDLGSDPLSWRTLYWTTSLKKIGTSYDVTLAATEPSAASYTYTFPDAGADANVMLDTGAANVIAYTKGTSTIAMAANADLDIATGITVNVDAAMTIGAAVTIGAGAGLTTSTEAITLNQSLSTTDSVQFATVTVTTLTDGTATLTAGGLTGLASLTTTGAIAAGTTLAAGTTVTCKGIINTTTAVDTTAQLQVGADNVYLTLGASDDTDSRIYFNGSGNLCFWDSDTSTTYTLRQLATGTTLNPMVTGDLTIADGKFNWTDAAAEAAAVWSFAGTTTTDIAITSSVSTGTVLSVTADACANGTLVYLDADGGVGATGYYLYCYNGSAAKFTVGEDGATVIGGNASGTDALTLTKGDILVSEGNVDITVGNLALANGLFTVATTTDSAHKIARNNATGTAAVLEIEETHATGGTTLLIDSNATDANDALVVEHDGTGSGLKITGTATTGTQATFIGPASQTTSSVIVDGTTGSWIGADNVGMLHLSSDGVLIAGANLLRVNATGANNATSVVELTSTGNLAAASDGAILKISETGNAQATTYAVNIASTNNEALHVDTGLSLFDERVTITLADNTGPALAITNPDTTGNSNAVTITPNGTGAGLYIDPQGTTTVGVKVVAKAASTVSQIALDLATNNWSGAANIGAIHSSADAVFADVAATQIYLGASDAIDDSRGHCLRIVDSSDVDGTMGYPVYVASNDATMGGVLINTHASGKALAITAGKTDIDGPVNLGSTCFFDGTPDTIAAASAAASLTTSITVIDSTVGGAFTGTLADGTQGQIKFVVMNGDGGDCTFTPANPLGYSTVKFTAIGQAAMFLFNNSKWSLIHSYGTTIAA